MPTTSKRAKQTRPVAARLAADRLHSVPASARRQHPSGRSDDRRGPAPTASRGISSGLFPPTAYLAEAQLRAAAIGMVVSAGYTFVDAHIWPRAADTRSVATALRTTLGLSTLRAMLDVGRKRSRPARLSEPDRSPPHVSPPEAQPLAHRVEIASLGPA